MTDETSKQADPLERIAIALLDEIRSRKLVVSPTRERVESVAPPPETTAKMRSGPRLPPKRERRVAMYPDHFSLRIRTEDRERFDAYADRHKLARGELFQLMLDALETQDREQKKR